MASERHHARMKQMLDDSVNKGANVFIGGKMDASVRYLSPTVLTEVPEDAPVMTEEIFGPLLPVLKIKNVDEAIDRINAGEKPLAMYVFSGKGSNVRKSLDNTSAGTTCVNDCLVQYLHPNLPFGGVNNSGHGSSHGYFGFKAFSHERAVLRHNSLAPMKLMYPPVHEFREAHYRPGDEVLLKRVVSTQRNACASRIVSPDDDFATAANTAFAPGQRRSRKASRSGPRLLPGNQRPHPARPAVTSPDFFEFQQEFLQGFLGPLSDRHRGRRCSRSTIQTNSGTIYPI